LGGWCRAVPAVGQDISVAVVSYVFLVVQRYVRPAPAGTAYAGILPHLLHAVQLVVVVGIAYRAAQLVNGYLGVAYGPRYPFILRKALATGRYTLLSLTLESY